MKTFCPECGFGVKVDVDGCCLYCGSVATGPAVDALANAANVCKCDGMRSASTICGICGGRIKAPLEDALSTMPKIDSAASLDPRVFIGEDGVRRIEVLLEGGEMKFSQPIDCKECQYFSQGDSENPDYCDADGTEFVEGDAGSIPDWCPLEDVPDTGEDFGSVSNNEMRAFNSRLRRG